LRRGDVFMNRKGQLGTVVVIFIGVIVCLVLIGSIANILNPSTDLQSVANESVSLAGFRLADGSINTTYVHNLSNLYPALDWRLGESGCNFASVVVLNQTNNTLTVTTHYTVNTTEGSITFEDVGVVNDSASNSTLVSYDYCDSGYNRDTASRTMLSLILIFAALAIILLVYQGIKTKF
jgi:hypothetical protein